MIEKKVVSMIGVLCSAEDSSKKVLFPYKINKTHSFICSNRMGKTFPHRKVWRGGIFFHKRIFNILLRNLPRHFLAEKKNIKTSDEQLDLS